jgi:RNA polymerase sigma-70 factor (ECF subfamily)
LEKRRRIVAWVIANIMPHEANVRAWLRRSLVPAEDIDDLIQEAYCKLASLDSIDHIERPDGYFFQIVRNLLNDQLRRARIVQIATVGELNALGISSDAPSPERIAAAKRELERVRGLIRQLPSRCRQIIELRKIDGLPQKEIAQRLGLSESVVENEGVRGMRLMMEALRKEEGEAVRIAQSEKDEQSRKLKRD